MKSSLEHEETLMKNHPTKNANQSATPKGFAVSGGFRMSGVPSHQVSFSEMLKLFSAEYAFIHDNNTHRARRNDLSAFSAFVFALERTPSLEILNQSVISDWIHSQIDEGLKATTINRKLSTIRYFCDWLVAVNALVFNPARQIRTISEERGHPVGLTALEIKRARAAVLGVGKDAFAKLRNRTILEILLRTGFRRRELTDLKAKQWRGELRTFLQVKTKGSKIRNIHLMGNADALIQAYLSERFKLLRERHPGKSNFDDFPFIITRYGAGKNNPTTWRCSPHTIYRIVKEVLLQAGVEPRRAKTHTLRHTFAFSFLEQTKTLAPADALRKLAQQLGHSDIRTTMIYTETPDESLASLIQNMSI